MSTAKAIKLLAKCEADLRSLVGAAAETGDYDSVLRITSWARHISALASAGSSLPAERRLVSVEQKKPMNVAYPRFRRRGDQLVKIGWSKREKREYEHKAPRQAALALAKTATEVGKDGRVFQVNALLPLRDAGDGSDIPDYQVYVVVAWWRSAGLLDQHGRQGYSIPEASRLSQAVESAWKDLSEN